MLGIPDEWAGERPKAYIVLQSSSKGDEDKAGERIIKYIQEKKIRHKWIVEIEFLDEIPKSASGKILRRILRDKARSGQHGKIVKDNRERARL